MRILINDLLQCSLLKLKLRLLQTMFLKLLRHKMTLCDLKLLLSKIAAHIDHLHTVLKSRLDILYIVCRSDEEDIRQIVVDIQIIIMESSILLRIKRFKKC